MVRGFIHNSSRKYLAVFSLITYLSIGNGLAVLVLVDNGGLLIDGLRQLGLGHFLGGTCLLDGLTEAEADLLIYICRTGRKQKGSSCQHLLACWDVLEKKNSKPSVESGAEAQQSLLTSKDIGFGI